MVNSIETDLKLFLNLDHLVLQLEYGAPGLTQAAHNCQF
jgi:hypothetical protein